MKKIFVLLAFLFIVIPTFSMEINTFDIRESYFKNDIKTYQNEVRGNLSIKGVWNDPKNYLKSILVEEIFCDIKGMICTSSVVDINFIGTPSLPPYLDVYGLTYKIIDYSPSRIKLFCSLTNYTIDIDLKTKKVIKYKIFENGDVNKYIMIFDTNYAQEYFKTFIK